MLTSFQTYLLNVPTHIFTLHLMNLPMSVRLSIGHWPKKIQKKSKLRHLEIESYVSNGWVVISIEEKIRIS